MCCYGSSKITYKDETHLESNTKERFLKLAFLAKLEKTKEGLEISNMKEKGAAKITRYMNFNQTEGYIYIII